MSERLVIGLVGRMKSGKSTAADVLVSHLGFVEKYFAEPLKTTIAYLFRMSREQLYSQEGKEKWDERYDASPRIVMQWFGQTVRDRFPGVWEMRLKEAVLEDRTGRPIVVSDIRYDAEAEAVRELGGTVIKIVRPEQLTLGQKIKQLFDRRRWHKSERGIRKDLVDIVIVNDGTLSDLKRTVISTVKQITEEKTNAVQEVIN